MPILTYIEALAKGMWEEMERDPSVFMIGEDIGVYGGAFKATKTRLRGKTIDHIRATLADDLRTLMGGS